jgi:hypothetical protein
VDVILFDAVDVEDLPFFFVQVNPKGLKNFYFVSKFFDPHPLLYSVRRDPDDSFVRVVS